MEDKFEIVYNPNCSCGKKLSPDCEICNGTGCSNQLKYTSINKETKKEIQECFQCGGKYLVIDGYCAYHRKIL